MARENIIIHRDDVIKLFEEMNKRTFNGKLVCSKIQDFLFEDIQTEDFEIFNKDANVTLTVSFVPAEDDKPRHVFLDLFEGTVNEEMCNAELIARRISEIIIVPKRFYIMTKYKGGISHCQIIDSYCAENYEPFELLWSGLESLAK